jgi:hypothetical protein
MSDRYYPSKRTPGKHFRVSAGKSSAGYLYASASEGKRGGTSEHGFTSWESVYGGDEDLHLNMPFTGTSRVTQKQKLRAMDEMVKRLVELELIDQPEG